MRLAVIVLAIVAVVAAGVAGYAIWKVESGSAKVPDVTGMQVAQAQETLSDAGYSAVQEQTFSSSASKGAVVSQSPAAGDKAAKGSDVTIWVSEGSPQVAVPDVSGDSTSQADTLMSAAGLNASIVAGSSGTAAKGVVYAEVPKAGTQVPRGSVITVYYNSTSPTVTVPSLIGMTQAQATSRLRQAGLALGAVGTGTSRTALQGTVISQSVPATEQVARGSAVSVVLSGGPPATVVPDVLNMAYKQAESTLQNDGFEVRVTWVKGTGMAMGQVVKVTPAVGTPAPQGALVVIEVEEIQQ